MVLEELGGLEPGQIELFDSDPLDEACQLLVLDYAWRSSQQPVQQGVLDPGEVDWGTTLDANLMQLYEKGVISYENLITKCQDPDLIVETLKTSVSKKR